MARFREENPNWRGGRSITEHGYVLIRVGTEHHLADVRGYAYEHRLVAEKNLGRRLLPDEVAYHRDGDRQNNDPGNILVSPSVGHLSHARGGRTDTRAPGEKNPEITCECGCGAALLRFDRWGRPRRYISGHNIHPGA